MKTDKPQFVGQVLLNKGFRAWFKYMFYVIEGGKFIEEDLHGGLFTCFEDLYDQKENRVSINVPPRSGKTTMATYFMAYCWAKNPKSNFIYTSFSQSLLADIARAFANILEHPIYKAMYNLEIKQTIEEASPIDEYWKAYLMKEEGKKVAKYSSRKIVSPAGGVILFASIGSAITGFGVGHRGSDGFSGALLCFPYDEIIHTENGAMKIGEIVDGKKNVRVWSYNHESGKAELKAVSNFIKNNTEEKQTFVRVELSNGKSFVCTDNHEVYTKNRGYVEAKNLRGIDRIVTLPDSLDLVDGKPSFLNNKITAIISIPDKIKLTFRELPFNARRVFNIARKTLKRPPCFYRLHSPNAASVLFRYLAKCAKALSYPLYIRFSKITTGKNECTKGDRILHVVGFSPISKVFKPIVGRIRIKMPDLNPFMLHTNESPKDKAMDTKRSSLVVFTKVNNLISIAIGWIKPFFFKCYFSALITAAREYCAFKADNITKIGNLIRAFIFGDIFVNNVVVCGHDHHSYCVTVRDNNNLFVGKCKVLASNCDDGNKPADMHSEVMRKKVITYFEETLLSRLNNPNAAIVNIQQRLHLQDLTGVLSEKYKFKELVKPLLIDGVCQLPSQYTPERLAEIMVNDYMFKAQYQQEPIQYGGFVFKTEWWKYYDILPEIKYTKMFADTALKTKEHNDYSVFQLWGADHNENMYLMDQLRGKWEAYDLEIQALAFWRKCAVHRPRSFAIEDKASGTGLIQNLQSRHSIPVEAKQVDRDKYTRAMDIQPHIRSGFVYLPEDAEYLSGFVNEFSAFSPLMTHAHDDQIDTAMHAIDDMRIRTNVSILDVL